MSTTETETRTLPIYLHVPVDTDLAGLVAIITAAGQIPGVESVSCDPSAFLRGEDGPH